MPPVDEMGALDTTDAARPVDLSTLDSSAPDAASGPPDAALAVDSGPDVAPDLWEAPSVETNIAVLTVTAAAAGFEPSETLELATLGASVLERASVAYSVTAGTRTVNLKFDGLNLLPGRYACTLDASPPVEEIMVTLRVEDGENTHRYVARDGVGRCAWHYTVQPDGTWAGTLEATLVDDIAGIGMLEVELAYRFAPE